VLFLEPMRVPLTPQHPISRVVRVLLDGAPMTDCVAAMPGDNGWVDVALRCSCGIHAACIIRFVGCVTVASVYDEQRP